MDADGFHAGYLATGTAGSNPRAATYRSQMATYVQQTLQLTEPPDFDSAWQLYRGFPAAAQRQFAQQVQRAEFAAVYLDTTIDAAGMTARLQAAFDSRKAQIVAAGEAALQAGTALVLPGRLSLSGPALVNYLASMRALGFAEFDLSKPVTARVQALDAVRSLWRDTVAGSLGSTAKAIDDLAKLQPSAPLVLAFQASLADRGGSRFEDFRQQVLASEIQSAGSQAAEFGVAALPMRLALFDQGFQAAELAGAGSFVSQPVWPGSAGALRYAGGLDITQSAVVTERGGTINLVNPGGAINVGLKVSAAAAAKGVIALGGGDVFGLARDDFQVNTQRVFIVGSGDMTLWSSAGDIDSGRGANTAVAAPPLAARRVADGVVFEIPATTTGSGLGILPGTDGRVSGTIGLYPAFGEIRALDAFIRAPSINLGGETRGADNVVSPNKTGGSIVVPPPPVAVSSPASTSSSTDTTAASSAASTEARVRTGLLTVDLLGLGEAPAEADCSLEDERAGKCKRPAKPAAPADAPARPAVPADRQR